MLREFSKEAGSKKYNDQYPSHTLIVLGSKTILFFSKCAIWNMMLNSRNITNS